MALSARISAELKGDRVIWAIILLLAVFSLLAVYSSTGALAYRERGGDTIYYLFKHGVLLGAGLLIVYSCHLLHYSRYSRWAPVMLALSVPLLVYTLLLGTELNEARRWIQLPVIGLTFQTSDFAKIATIVYVARSISGKQEYIKDFKSAFLPIILPVLIVCGLIAPADLSSALLLFLICILMMVIGRVDIRYIGLLFMLGTWLFAMLYLLGKNAPNVIRVDTWESRMEEFMSEEPGFQVTQAKIAMANGGLFGVGPGNSLQRNYLPSPYSDFIYAIIVEEYGLLGGVVIISLYLLLFFRVTRLVTKSSKAFGAMVALGLSLAIVLQAFVNIAVAVNLVPVTGLTLPLISRGGTSILFTCVAFGIILSVSKYIESTSEVAFEEEILEV